MDVLRTNSIPAIYAHLPFVRLWKSCILADCSDDLSLLRLLQRVAAGNACVSVLEAPHELFVKATFPDDIQIRSGNTGDIITWQCCCWKLWDAESVITGTEPGEAVDLNSAGIESDYLQSLAHPTSCIPFLQKIGELFPTGYSLNAERKRAIELVEQPIIAALEVSSMKRLDGPRKRRQCSSTRPSISESLRTEIMRRDDRCCIFCGKAPPAVTIEVDHIIPRSLVNKLHLDTKLYTSPENLCVTCFECNRGKRDHLAKEDIAFYIRAFSAASHPNHAIVCHLETFAELQTL